MNNGIKIPRAIRVGDHRAPYEFFVQHNGISGVRTHVAYEIGCDNCAKSLRFADNMSDYSDCDFESRVWETRIDFSRVFCPSNGKWKCQADGHDGHDGQS